MDFCPLFNLFCTILISLTSNADWTSIALVVLTSGLLIFSGLLWFTTTKYTKETKKTTNVDLINTLIALYYESKKSMYMGLNNKMRKSISNLYEAKMKTNKPLSEDDTNKFFADSLISKENIERLISKIVAISNDFDDIGNKPNSKQLAPILKNVLTSDLTDEFDSKKLKIEEKFAKILKKYSETNQTSISKDEKKEKEIIVEMVELFKDAWL